MWGGSHALRSLRRLHEREAHVLAQIHRHPSGDLARQRIPSATSCTTRTSLPANSIRDSHCQRQRSKNHYFLIKLTLFKHRAHAKIVKFIFNSKSLNYGKIQFLSSRKNEKLTTSFRKTGTPRKSTSTVSPPRKTAREHPTAKT